MSRVRGSFIPSRVYKVGSLLWQELQHADDVEISDMLCQKLHEWWARAKIEAAVLGRRCRLRAREMRTTRANRRQEAAAALRATMAHRQASVELLLLSRALNLAEAEGVQVADPDLLDEARPRLPTPPPPLPGPIPPDF